MSIKYYSSKGEKYFSSERREMIPFIPTSAKFILEVGCGNGYFSQALKSEREVHITGIEPHLEAATAASAILDHVIAMGVEGGVSKLLNSQFDCIVFNDVLEHMTDPWQTLETIRPLLKSGGVVVASIPNIRYFPVFRELVQQANWRYQKDGVMDKTHLRFFTKSTIVNLFLESGYRVEAIEGINRLELPWKFALFNAMLGHRFDDTQFQQYACVAKLSGSA